MSIIRFEQTKDTSHISHVHDGTNGNRIDYIKSLHTQQLSLECGLFYVVTSYPWEHSGETNGTRLCFYKQI